MRAEALAAALLLTGCSTVCQGPGCVGSYGSERLAVFPWTPDLSDTLDAWADAPTRYDGSADDGADWAVIPGPPGTLLIGMPDASRVVRVPLGPGASEISPEFEIVGSGAAGASLASADIDGDGTRDLILGAPETDFAAGAVYVFLGAGATPTDKLSLADADLSISGTSPSDRLGSAIVPCADLTGDGLPEFLVTAPWLAVPNDRTEEIPPLAGGVFLFESELLSVASGTVTPWELGRVWWGDAEGDALGRSLICRADFTGDREPDLAFGAPFALEDGRVYLMAKDGVAAALGQPSLPQSGSIGAVADAVVAPSVPDAWFGSALAAGEFDGAPPLDLVVGSPGAHTGEGRVDIFRGSALLTDPQPWRVIRNESTRDEPDHLGRAVEVGDLDLDGSDDLIVGAPDWYGGGNDYDSGAAFVWTGVAVGLIPALTVGSAEWTIEGTQPFQQVGRNLRVIQMGVDLPAGLLIPTRTTPPEDE